MAWTWSCSKELVINTELCALASQQQVEHVACDHLGGDYAGNMFEVTPLSFATGWDTSAETKLSLHGRGYRSILTASSSLSYEGYRSVFGRCRSPKDAWIKLISPQVVLSLRKSRLNRQSITHLRGPVGKEYTGLESKPKPTLRTVAKSGFRTCWDNSCLKSDPQKVLKSRAHRTGGHQDL